MGFISRKASLIGGGALVALILTMGVSPAVAGTAVPGSATDPTASPSATATPLPTDTASPTPNPTESTSPSPTPSAPQTPTPTPTPTVTSTPTATPTPSWSPPAPVSNNLPTLDITLTDPTQTLSWVNSDKDNRAVATLSLSDPSGSSIAPQAGGELKGRGNYTWGLAKKPYQIKFPSSTDVLGMGAGKTWILLANHADASLMRNKLAFDFADAIGIPYSPASRWVDVRINGVYQGNYLISEKVEVKKNRADLSHPQAILTELDNNYGVYEDYYFRSSTTGTVFTLKDAKSGVDDLPDGVARNTPGYLSADTQAGWDDMKASLNKLDAALHAPNPDWSVISSLIDVDSFVKYYFVFEVTENPEIVASSVYFYKNGPADKIHAGPVWDFDSGLFNYDKSEHLGADTSSDYVKNGATLRAPKRSTPSNPWFQDIFRNVAFVQRANELWNGGIGNAVSALPAKIDAYAATTSTSASKNFALWKVLGQPTLLQAGEGKTYASTYAGEVSYLRSKVSARAAFLRSEYGTVPVLRYRAYIQSVGWDWYDSSGQIVGTFGKSLRLEGFSLSVADLAGQSGGVEAMSHVQGVGWNSWGSAANVGTTGKSLRLEAVRFRLTGDLASKYDVQYRAHVQNVGWQAWVANSATAGTVGQSLRIEALQVRLVIKAGVTPSPSPSATSTPTPTATPTQTATPSPTATATPTPSPSPTATSNPTTSYSAHVQTIGWTTTVKNGATAGTIGKALRVEALRLTAGDGTHSGGVSWRGQVQNVGWQPWTSAGEIGTTGKGLRLEAFEIKLTGELASLYTVRYRAHVQNIGWQGWKTDGQTAGTVGQSLRVEAVEIVLVPRG